MNLNSKFASVPVSANIQRSKFKRDQDHKTTMSAGLLYPVFVDEVLPGDTFTMDTRVFARMSTPIHPVYDNCYLDINYFFIPYRLVWDNFKTFMGEPPEDNYEDPVQLTVPALIRKLPEGEPEASLNYYKPAYKSVADYMGIPPLRNLPKNGISALPFRAYALVWNEWYRPQTIFNAIEFPRGDEDQYLYGFAQMPGSTIPYPFGSPAILRYVPPYDYSDPSVPDFFYWPFYSTAAYGGYLAPVRRNLDYFSSCLPEPQRGDPVPIPLSGIAPVIPIDATVNVEGDNVTSFTGNQVLVEYEGGLYVGPKDFPPSGQVLSLNNSGIDLSMLKQYSPILANISDLRYAFQMQKFLEADNRYGTRYREMLRGHFNVTPLDASLQVPEFLGGRRVRLNMTQVLQTSSTDSTSPQGNTAAYSATLDVSNSFSKSFTEHGLILGLACIRTDHTYQQGIERFWMRKDKFDFYFPEFAHISNQPVYNFEIFSGTDKDYEVFGFQEAYADYRYKPNRISGEFRSDYPYTLDSWHYGDDYFEVPTLTSAWMTEPRANINRTLAVSDEISDQFLVDWYFDCDTVRPMPVYSIPGMADHF